MMICKIVFKAHLKSFRMTGMKLVIIESPYAASEHHTVEQHVEYARRCLKDSLSRGEAPFASHLLYTQPGVLNDLIPEERRRGMEAGFAYRQVIKKTVVYTDYDVSPGMDEGLEGAEETDSTIERRTIGKNPV